MNQLKGRTKKSSERRGGTVDCLACASSALVHSLERKMFLDNFRPKAAKKKKKKLSRILPQEHTLNFSLNYYG